MKLFINLSIFFLAVSSHSIKDKVDEVREKYPQLDKFVANFDLTSLDQQREDEFQLSNSVDMKYYLDTIFRFWDFKGTQMGQFIEDGQLPNMEELQKQFSLYTILERLENDEELQEDIMQTLVNYAKWKDNTEESTSDEPISEHNQTGGYAGCKMDYDSLAEPITNALLGLSPIPIPIEDREMERWGWLMFDALTKIPAGLTDGKLHWVGSYELCNKIEVNYNYTEAGRVLPPPKDPVHEPRHFKAKYCRLDFNPQNQLIGNGSDSLKLQLGICVPDTCSSENITTYLTAPFEGIGGSEGNIVLTLLLQVLGLRLDAIYCGQVTDYNSDPKMQAAVGIILTCFLLLVIATLYDGFIRPRRMKPYIDTIPKKQHLARSISQISEGVEAVEPPMFASGNINAMNGTKPPIMRQTSYHEVNKDELRRYSLTDNNANNSNNKPGLSSQISTSSINPLIENIYTAQIEQDKPGIWDRIEVAFVGFSAYSNLRRVFCTENCIENELPALNGVRFLSWAYALYGHTWLFGPVYNECWTTGNLFRALKELPRKWSFQPVINFHFSADAFFVISGCLVAYWWLKKHQQMKGLSVGFILRYYIYRYWMLMPALMLVVMTYTTSYRYLTSGPLSPIDVNDAENCKTNWWTDLLLVHNLVQVDKMCLTWTWYTGILWQLHIITPIVLIPLVIQPIVGYVMLGLLYIAHVGATAGIISGIVDEEGSGAKSWAKDYFLTPWCRIGPYIVGLALGIILFKRQLKAKINIFLVILGWIAAMVCICSVEYATYGILKEGGERWDKGTRVMYDTFSRTTYGVGVAWIIFACVTGNGGIINSILAWKVFIPLSRIVYPSYLLHAMIMYSFVYGQYSLMYVNESNVLYWFFGHLWMVHIIGLFYVGLFFYYPISCGIIRAFSVKTKLECVKAGCHPELPESIDSSANDYIRGNPSYNVPSIDSVSKKVSQDLRQRQISPQPDVYETLSKKTTEF